MKLTQSAVMADLSGCELTNVLGSFLGGIVANVLNFFQAYAPWIGLALLALGVLLIMNDKGAGFFRWGLIIVAGVFLLEPAIGVFAGLSGGSCSTSPLLTLANTILLA